MGTCTKLSANSDLLQAITDLLSGRIYVPQWVAERQDANVETISASLELESLNLTPRQREVLPLLARGMSAKEIARALNIAVGTTKIHTAALLHALGARNRTEGAFIAARIMGDEGRLSLVHSRPSQFLEITTKDNDVRQFPRSSTGRGD